MRVRAKAVEKLIMARSAVDRMKTMYRASRTPVLICIIPSTSATKMENSPKTIAKSVQLPKGLPMLPKKLPQTKTSPPRSSLIETKTAISEIERKKAVRAWSAEEESESIMAARSNRAEPSSTKPKVPTSKLYPKSDNEVGVESRDERR